MTAPEDHDLLIAIDTKLVVALMRVDDHERRIRIIEAKVWTLAGGASVLGTVAGMVGTQVLGLR